MSVAKFEDHCWKDIVTPDILETYKPYHRETYIGQRPALLAIDLYNLVYEGGPKQPHELVKDHKSFFGTPLVAHLTQQGIDSLIVCGESTSGCVRASCVDGYSLGYHVSLVEECVFDRSPLSHKVNLFDLHHKYSDVMKLDEVKENLMQERPRRAG